MAARYRWFNIGVPYGFDQLAERLQSHKLSESMESGFAVERAEPTHISGNLVTRSRLKILRVQGDGSTSEEVVSTIALLAFSIFSRSNKTWLRISDPPRSSRELTNALERAVGIGFFVESVIFSQATFNSILERVDECRLISTKGLAALHESKALARIEIASKEGIDLESLPLLKGLEYIVDTAVFEVTYRRERGQILFAKSGLVRVNGPLSERLIELVEETLR